MNLSQLRLALKGISAYRDLCKLPLMAEMAALLDAVAAGEGEQAAQHYIEVFYALRQEDFTGLGDWLEAHLRYDEAPYPLLIERGGSDPDLETAARRDIETLRQLSALDCGALTGAICGLLPDGETALADALPHWSQGAAFDFETLTEGYRTQGAGLFARYQAVVWEHGELTPIAKPDSPTSEELLGYDAQRQAVIDNTRALLAGHAVNNILLYGDSGTGKSATVKSLLSVEGFDDLRIVELQKEELGGIPALIRQLGHRRQKFILFIDDLAFDQDDRTYSVLKTILEGGLEPRPANVAVYATSNRRHLVRQTFSDRTGDEVDCTETIQEKTALADRFGVRILFSSLSKGAYLALAEHLADRAGITMDREELRKAAMEWEIRHSGRTPRTAQQFIASLKR